MLRSFSVLLCVCVMLSLAGAGEVYGAGIKDANLYGMCSEMKKVSVYVDDITDAPGGSGADIAGLKTAIVNALRTRQTIHFEIADVKEDADLEIACEVVEYYYTNKDPLDMIGGVGSIVVDVMTTTDYARMRAVFRVRDVKKDKLLWEKKIMATITDDRMIAKKLSGEGMTKEESVGMINDKMAEVFIRDCFSKSRSRPRKLGLSLD